MNQFALYENVASRDICMMYIMIALPYLEFILLAGIIMALVIMLVKKKLRAASWLAATLVILLVAIVFLSPVFGGGVFYLLSRLFS